MTEVQFRNRGIMMELLKFCLDAFYRSPAEMLCCASGNPYAVASYRKAGFELIYGGERGPLCLIRKGTFFEAAREAFQGARIAKVRCGTIGDQFDCDKFLAYIPEVKKRPIPFCGGPLAEIPEELYLTLLKLVSPFAPHLAEEMWARMGKDSLIVTESWPVGDPKLAEENTVTIAVQICGKMRGTIEMPKDAPQAEAEAKALALENVVRQLSGRPVKKIIVVPNRIINIVA